MIWKSKKQNRDRNRADAMKRRSRPERLETRRLLAADAIHVGVVYLETDYLETDQDVGSDSQGDRFILSFTGGAPGTELSELRIRTDKDGDGLSVGDPMFDTELGGRGKGGAHGFEIVRVRTSDGRVVDARAEVEDGGQELVLRLSNFRAGDRLEFTLDVDEVLRNSLDLAVFNDRLDVITSGQEFQDSILAATFEAPHYEKSHADAVFANNYGDPSKTHGLSLPPDEGDDIDSRPNRSAAAVASTNQVPKPVEISGNVWVDNDLDARRDAGENPLANVTVALWKRDASGQYRDTSHRATTDAQGKYEFPASLGLMPGNYRVMQEQPDHFFSVAAVPGTTNGSLNGRAETKDVITDIDLPLGDTSAINQDFAEAAPASLRGFVYQDMDNDGRRDPGEPGIGGIRVRLDPVQTISASQSSLTVTTASDGSYAFDGIAPGTYEVTELDQPINLSDGLDTAGTVDGRPVGSASNPGDRISSIALDGGDAGIEFNFGELPYGSISGFVYLAAPGSDCSGEHDGPGNERISGARVRLQNGLGETIAETVSDAQGGYRFEQVPVGNYRLVQETPAGLIDGRSHVGTIDHVRVGDSVDGGLIQHIVMTPGGEGVGYDFCEAAPASISGYVYHDASNDGRRDSSEDGIAGVRLYLIDSNGQTAATTQSNAEGAYRFDGVIPGEYTIREEQPGAYLDGLDSAGTVQGQTRGRVSERDKLTGIQIQQGEHGVEFNFGELLATSLSGRVHADLDGDCEVDENETLLAGVIIELLSSDGSSVASTTTDASGTYHFTGLAPGTYRVVQQQPEGYFDGDAHAGSVGGRVLSSNVIDAITLESGDTAVGYDFCELEPSSLSGLVYVDQNGDCLNDPSEPGLSGVTIELRSGTGQLIATTQTDQSGRYRFDLLQPGDYQIHERHPEGYFQGGQHAGSGEGSVLGRDLLGATLGSGQSLVDYNFCEIAPSSISGSVWSETDSNRIFDDGEQPVPGVVIELLNESGEVSDTTQTNSRGEYRFSFLSPGVYSVRQVQPTGLFHGGQVVGSAGGEEGGENLLVGIELAGGVSARDYDFPEIPPATISGFVFQDGDVIVLEEPPAPESLRDYQDGERTPDDIGIANVTIQLRDEQGRAVNARDTLGGTYPLGAVEALTDGDGFYQFTGLRPGTYHIYQVHPEGFVDGLDTAGSKGGFAVNAGDALSPESLAVLDLLSAVDSTNPGTDAILSIRIAGGESSTDNNFSELVVEEPPTFTPYRPLDDPIEFPGLTVTPSNIEDFQQPIRISAFAAPGGMLHPLDPYRMLWDARDEWAVSWHLSVINGGYPRGVVVDGARVLSVSALKVQPNWSEGAHAKGNWSFEFASNTRQALHDVNLGDKDATALAGDFDGDGSDEAVIFVAGQWYVDLNGNGRWDSGDLWIRLGTELDRPVVGDWDGDGKDDVAIFGRRWQHDTARIVHDPGLPDPANLRRRTIDPRARAASEQAATEDQQRLLRRGNTGTLRADAVDHVFQYGEQVDTPVSGDWNGDGIDQIGVYRGGHWMLDADGDGRWTETDERVEFGRPGDEPVVGDFNGDKIDEIGVVRGDVWIIDTDGDRRITGNDQQIQVPRQNSDSQPVVGDFDGDGKDEPGYYDEAA